MTKHRTSRTALFKCSLLVALIACVVAFESPASGEMKAIEWMGEVCRTRVEFDPAKDDELSVRNTTDVVFGTTLARILGALPDQSRRPAFDAWDEPKSLAALREYQQRCDEDLEAQSREKVIDLPSMSASRNATIAGQRDFCRFQSTATQAALGDYSALREYTLANADCSHYVDALEGKTSLEIVWRQTVENLCTRNGDPSGCLSRWFADATGPERTSRMMSYVLTYGWRNCAVRYLHWNRMDDEDAERQRMLASEFRARFTVTETDCIDVD